MPFLVFRLYIAGSARYVAGAGHAIVIQGAKKKSFYMKILLLPEKLKKGKGPFGERFACRYKK